MKGVEVVKSNTLVNISKLVHGILQTDTQARNSDHILYLRVLQRVTAATGSPVSPRNMSVDYFLRHMKDLGYPPFESVRRARQKVQRDHPELRASEQIEEYRSENEKEYRRFSHKRGRTQ